MRYAIATSAPDTIADHFGRCDGYTLVDIHDGRESGRAFIDNPGHEPGLLPRLLKQHGVACVLAGGAGPRAIDLLGQLGIDICVGASGSIDDVIDAIVADDITTGESTCDH